MAMPNDVGLTADISLWYYDKHMPKGWRDAARPYQKYTFAKLVKDRVKRNIRGTGCSFNMLVGDNANTEATQLYDDDTVTRTEMGLKGSLDWHMQKTHMLYDRREEVFQSRSLDGERILDHLNQQKRAMYDGFFKQNEHYLWTSPAATADGTTGTPILPYGIPYHVVKAASAGDFGFNGIHASGYSAWAGNSRSTYPELKNGTFTYADVTHEDFCQNLSEAFDKCNFSPPEAPVDGEIVPTQDYELLSHYTPYQKYQLLQIGSNDSIGPDMGKYRGVVGKSVQYFRSVPWSYVPALALSSGTAEDTDEPIYGLDWSTWQLSAAEGMFMHIDPPQQQFGNHNVYVQWMDSIYQIICDLPRSNFVGHKA